MLADSQSQELYKQLGHLEEEFDVNVSSVSGSKVKNVIRNGLGSASDWFYKTGFLLLLAGSNDVKQNEPYQFLTFILFFKILAKQPFLEEILDLNLAKTV